MKSLTDYINESSKITIKTPFIDLGLPSGTKWASQNVDGFFTYDESVKLFKNSLPTKEQFEELISECVWKWFANGYNITGPNGNSIYLPCCGYRDNKGKTTRAGFPGDYWTSTGYHSDEAYCLCFNDIKKFVWHNNRNYGQSVRHVMSK